MTTALRNDDQGTSEPCGAESDEALLRAFVQHRDDLVFARLVTRHAGLVMGVCRQVLGGEQEAEDAFQATFLVLARKAGALRSGKSLPAWLHKTAHRIALRARANKARRREQPLESEAMLEDFRTFKRISLEHERSILDEELNRLPDRYRLPLFLCCIEGKSRDEAASQLGWSISSLKGRLERARQLLRRRLILRSVSLSVAAALLLRSQAVAQASIPPSLVVSTVQAGLRFAAGRSPVGYVSPEALSLANWSLQAMSITLFKCVACSLLVIGGLALGNRWLAGPAAAEASHTRVVVAVSAAAPPTDFTFVAFADDDKEEGEARQERERAEGREREQREEGERRELPGEVREKLEQLRRRHAELREAGKADAAEAVEREIKQLLERVNAAKREGGEQRELPGEVREKLAQLKRRVAELREAGKADAAEAVEREIGQLLERFNAAKREGGQQRELPGEVREKLAQLKRQVAELREAGKADAAEAVEREIKQLLERVNAAKREGGEQRELPGEVREKLAQLKRRQAELREAGKADAAGAVEREIKQLLERFSAPRQEGERRKSEIDEKLQHLRAAAKNLRAAGLNDLAAQVVEQIGRLERESGQRREGEGRDRAENERREAEARERREREKDEPREREERRERE